MAERHAIKASRRSAFLFFFAAIYGMMIAADRVLAADGTSAPYSYYLVSCYDFMQERHSSSRDVNATADTFYVAGWISAYNRLEPEGALPDDISLDEVMPWLETYCSKNHSGTLQEGLYRLTQEIRLRHPAKPAKAEAAPAPKHPHRKKPVSPKPPNAPPASQPWDDGLKPLEF